MIVALQEDLAKKNVRIQELDEMVSSLNEDVENLATTAAAQSEKLGEQDKHSTRLTIASVLPKN